MFSFSSPTLYVGEHEHGLFAMPSLVDRSQTLTISAATSRLRLIEGPKGSDEDTAAQASEVKPLGKYDIPEVRASRQTAVGKPVLLLGYYNMPEWSQVDLVSAGPRVPQITAETPSLDAPSPEAPRGGAKYGKRVYLPGNVAVSHILHQVLLIKIISSTCLFSTFCI